MVLNASCGAIDEGGEIFEANTCYTRKGLLNCTFLDFWHLQADVILDPRVFEGEINQYPTDFWVERAQPQTTASRPR